MQDAYEPTADEVSDDSSADLTGNPWAEAGWPEDEWPKPWMLLEGPFICGDGSPTFAMLGLKEKDPRYKTKAFRPLNGGFHTTLEHWDMPR